MMIVAAPPPLPPPPLVMRLGVGFGPLQIGRRRIVFGDLVRTERHRENDAGGCSGSPMLDSWVDYYDGRRLGYVLTYEKKTYLDTIMTTRVGDRTAVGFAIGRATFAQVRRRYPSARVTHVRARYWIGATQIVISVRTGYESWKTLKYSFDADGTLIALETSVGGC